MCIYIYIHIYICIHTEIMYIMYVPTESHMITHNSYSLSHFYLGEINLNKQKRDCLN